MGEINPREFFIEDKSIKKAPEEVKEDSGSMRSLLNPGTKFFLKYFNSDKFIGFKIPEEIKLEVFRIRKEENKELSEKLRCKIVNIYLKNEEGKYRIVESSEKKKFRFKKKGFKPIFVKQGDDILCRFKDLKDQLISRQRLEKEEIAERSEGPENVYDINKRIINNWPKGDKLDSRYKDEYEDGDNDH